MSDSDVNDFSFSKTADPEVVVVTNTHFPFARLRRGRYPCSGCPMKFYTKFLLNLHRVTRCSKLPYPCETCDLRFSNLLNFKNHQKIHLIPQKKKTMVAVARERIQAKLQGKSQKTKDEEEPRPKILAKDSDVMRNSKEKTDRFSNFRHHQRLPQREEGATKHPKTHLKFLKEEAFSFIHRQESQTEDDDFDSKKANLKVLKAEDSDTGGESKKKKKKRILKKEYASRRNPERNARELKNSFPCQACHLTFPGIGKLDRHMRVHSGKRSFQCRKCHMGFYWKSNFNRHVRTQCPVTDQPPSVVSNHHHQAGKLHMCVTCDRVFNRRFSLLRHQQTRHPEEVEPPVKEEVFDEETEANSSHDTLSDPTHPKTMHQLDAKRESGEGSEPDASKKSSSEKDEGVLYCANYQPDGKYEPEATLSKRKKVPKRKYTCDVCHIRFRWKCDLNRHRTTHSDVKAYPCDQCELGFNWKSNLTRHQKRVHAAKTTANHRCDMCGFCFATRHHLARHVDAQCTKRPELVKREVVQEEVVVKQETEEEDVEEPEEILPDVSQNVNIVYLHVCQNEGSVYNAERSCENIQSAGAEYSESASESISCDVARDYGCSKPGGSPSNAMLSNRYSKDSGDISVHIVKEGGTCIPQPEDIPKTEEKKSSILEKKRFVCSKCGRVFNRKTCHVQHERSHDRQSVKCRWCGRDFHRQSLLEKHERIHAAEEPSFTCEFCGSVFAWNSQLARHLKESHSSSAEEPLLLKEWHSSEESSFFECEFCKCRFGRKGLLDRHRMIHTEHPYKCELCELTFNQRCSLVLHQRVHAGEVPYKCGKCDLRFAHKLSYDRHLERVHFCEGPPTKKKNGTSNKTRDPHVYNTRFKREKVDRVEGDKCAATESDQGNNAAEHDAVDIESDSEPKSRSAIDVAGDDGWSKPSGNAMLNNRNCDSIASLTESAPCLRNPKEVGAIDQRPRPKKAVGIRATKVSAKSLVPRRDINAYKSESINEFIKSYKRKNGAKYKTVDTFQSEKDSGSQAGAKENPMVDAEVDVAIKMTHNKKSDAAGGDGNRNVEITREKKSNKSRSRRCSKEIEISEGLANFHIGLGDVSEIDANHSGKRNPNAKTVESCSFTESTKQGTYIFQDIITVENSTSNSDINLKCNEEMSTRDENGKDRDSANDNSESSGTIKIVENQHRRDNCTDIKKLFKYVEEFPFSKGREAYEGSLKKNETPPNGESVLRVADNNGSLGESAIESGVKAVVKITDRVSLHTMRVVNESISASNGCGQNTECEKDKKWSMEHERTARMEHQGMPKLVPANSNEASEEYEAIHDDTQRVHCASPQEANDAYFSESSFHKNEQDAILNKYVTTPEETQVVGDDRNATNTHFGNFKSMDLSTKLILHSMQEKYSNDEETTRSPIRSGVDILKQKELHSRSPQNDSRLVKTQVPKKDSENFGMHKEKDCMANMNDLTMKFYPVTSSLCNSEGINFNNNDQRADEADLVQEHQMHKDLATNDVLSLESNDLIDEIHIGKDICEIHNDKNDCISGICTDNDDCISEIYTENDRIGEIKSDRPDKCLRSIVAGTSNDCSGNFEVTKSDHSFRDRNKIDIDCVRVISHLYDNPLTDIKREKQFNQCARVTDNRLMNHDLNNCELTCSKTMDVQSENRISKEPVQTGPEFVQLHNNNQAVTLYDENLRFQYVHNNPTSPPKNELNQTFHNHQAPVRTSKAPVWKELFNGGPNTKFHNSTASREPLTQFRLHTSNEHNVEETDTLYTARDQDLKGKPFILNPDTNTKHIVHLPRTDNGFPYQQHETTWNEAQHKQHPINRHFATCNNNDNVTEYRSSHPNIEAEASYHKKNQWNQHLKFQDGAITERVSSEIPSNLYVQDASYGTDIDEESIQYAVQTVQAIIQSDAPICRESAPAQEIIRYETQSFQVPVQNDITRYGVQGPCDGVQEIIRYQTQNPLVPLPNDGYGVQGLRDRESVFVQAPVQEVFRYQTQSFQVPVQNDGYGAQYGGGSNEGFPPTFQSSSQYRGNNFLQETIKYDAQNAENPFLCHCVDHNAVRNSSVQRIRTSESCIDQDGRIVQLPVQYGHFSQYPEHHTEGYVRQNSVLQREQDSAHFEDGFPGPRPLLDLVPVPYSSSSEPFSYERAPTGLNVQISPYERVEITKTVYTNLELASYGKSPGDAAYIPCKEMFNDSGILHKEQQRSIVQYKDMYPYASENMYTHLVHPPAIRTAELVPSQPSFRYENSYPYRMSSSEINALQDSIVPRHSANSGHFENAVTYHNLYPNFQHKEVQNSVTSQAPRGRKRVRKARTEVLVPKKPRVRRKKKDCPDLERQNTDQVHFAIDLSGPKRAPIDQGRENPNRFDRDKNDPNRKICIGSCENISKNI